MNLYHMVLWDHMIKWNHYISTTTVPLATELGRVVNCHKGLSPIESHDLLITWPYKITRKNKFYISPPPQCLWPSNLVEWWLTERESHQTFWSRHLARSCDKIRPLYLLYHNTYDHQTAGWWLTERGSHPESHITLWNVKN